MRTVTLVFAGMLLVTMAAAQASVDVSPGLIKAGNPLHGVDTGFDNLLVDIGMKDPSTVTVERASELHDLHERDMLDSEQAETVTAAMEKHAEKSVKTVSSEVRVGDDGDVYVNGSDGTVRITDGDIHVSGPGGTVDITDGGIDVSGKGGDVSISDGSISVSGGGSSIDIDSEEIRVKAQKRQGNLQTARQILEQIQQSTGGDGVQTAIQQMQQHEQSMDQLQTELDQVEQQLQD